MDEPINGVAGQNFLQQQMNWWNYKYKLVQQQEIYEIKKKYNNNNYNSRTYRITTINHDNNNNWVSEITEKLQKQQITIWKVKNKLQQ